MALLNATLRRWGTPVTVILLMIGLVVLIMFLATRRIVVATNEWEPLIGSNLPHDGPMARVVKEALTRAGYDPIFSFGKWEDGYEAAANGRVRGTFPWIWTEQREERFKRSKSLVNLTYALFYRADNENGDIGRITDPEELRRRELKVGLVENYQLWGNISELVEVVPGYEDLRAAFEALDRGQVHLVAEVVGPALHFLYRARKRFDRSRFDYIRFEESPLTASDENWYLLTSATGGGQEFIDRFNEGLEEFKQTPLYRELVDSMVAGPERIRLISETEARDPLDHKRGYLLPAGTQASVIKWPAAFDRGTDSARLRNKKPLWSEVKVLSGPQRGRVLEVRADHIELINQH